MRVNLYYLRNGNSYVIDNVAVGNVGTLVTLIIQRGGEVTGIINVEDDQ